MFTYQPNKEVQPNKEEFDKTLNSLIKITKCKEETGTLYLQECQITEKKNLYSHYLLENCLKCIENNITQWKKMSLVEQETDLNKIQKIY